MTSYYIYKITCTAGSLKDHYYIGQHKTDNLNDGYKGSGIKIKKYYKKYPNDYKKEILCFCVDEDDLNQKEDFYVGDLYKTDPLCLNLVSGGMHRSCSDETRKKISDANKGKQRTEEIRKKLSDALTGKQHSEETRKKMSDARKGENNPMYGKHFTEESRKKMSNAAKNRSEEIRKKISDAQKGKTVSEETRKKLSDAVKGENNPSYGSKWMNNGQNQKFVKQDEVNLYFEKGYSFGRLKINAI